MEPLHINICSRPNMSSISTFFMPTWKAYLLACINKTASPPETFTAKLMTYYQENYIVDIVIDKIPILLFK